MKRPNKKDKISKEKAIEFESKHFEEYFTWLQEHMPDGFFEEVNNQQYTLIAHYLMGFPLQDNFCQIQLKNKAFVLSLDTPDTDVKILKQFNMHGIKNYLTFTSSTPPPFFGINKNLKIAIIYFTSFIEKNDKKIEPILSKEILDSFYKELQNQNSDITKEDFHTFLSEMDDTFIRSVSKERLIIAFRMYFRARTRDNCQYEIYYNEDWKKKGKNQPSLRIVFAWRSTPKYKFLFRMAKLIKRHNLKISHVNASYTQPYSKNNILIMSLGLHGIKGKAAWEESDIQDFLQEMVTLKYFPDEDLIEKVFIEPKLLRGNIGNFLRAMVSFVHQTLLHGDIHMYTIENIMEGLSRHPELTIKMCHIFELKFHPKQRDLDQYQMEKDTLITLIDHLDTGHEFNDNRRKNILIQGLHFIDFTLKTNFFRHNKSALSFRLNPNYLNFTPYNRREKFPEIPYGIFFIQGMHFIGFHIRFKDLSRGGLRTVFPERHEQMIVERNNVFIECYNLAFTQQKKNKDIPEGGSKGILFIEPYNELTVETKIFQKELSEAGQEEIVILETMTHFQKEQKIEYLYQIQRSFIHSIFTLLNCHDDGTLKAKDVIDYWKKPEYIYLGPDENMHNIMIEWIAKYSKSVQYKPGIAFISSKPKTGINHKEYGVTSLGVNVCMEEVLQFLGINPKKDAFTIKISGGPDGDVAGNQILNLYKHFPNTAKLLAITDVSGTIYDPKGLNLHTLVDLFYKGKPLAAYPPKKLHDNGFLLDLQTKKEQTAYTTKTLCWKKMNGKLIEEWLSGSDMNHLFRNNLNQIHTDIFIPAGGRPRTLNEHNWSDCINSKNQPTIRAIIEGANLYLTPYARRELEKKGVLIIKDSSANKGGVICSCMEVLTSLTLSEDEFIKEKDEIMKEILLIISDKARDEAQLLLKTHKETGEYLTDLSEKISEKINTYTYELLNYLEDIVLPSHPDDPLVKALLNFCPALLSEKYRERLIKQLPTINKRAIIACYIASRLVYTKGLKWQPSIVDVLPLIASDPKITSTPLKNHSFKILD